MCKVIFKSVSYFCLSFLLLSIITGCKKDSVQNPDIDAYKVYMPLHIGSQWVYELDSLTFSKTTGGIKIDTGIYLMREIIVDTFTNSAGDLIYVAERYERKTENALWEIKSVNGLYFNNNRYLRSEGNNTFIKFSLPPAKGSRWDGLALVDKTQFSEIGGEQIEVFKDWESRILGTNQKYNNGKAEYTDCFTVELADSESLVDFRSGLEVYSKGFGLVYSELFALDTQCGGNPADCVGIPWEQKAEKGFIVKQRLVSYQK